MTPHATILHFPLSILKKGMRPPLFLLIATLAATALTGGCKKHNDNADNVALLQHKWQITSLNGEALRYVGKSGDYFDFENGRLIEYFGSQYDTLEYIFTNNNQTLEFRTVTDNVVSGAPLDLNITSLTSSQLILDGSASLPILHILDSLQR
jgi:hypothetical protein